MHKLHVDIETFSSVDIGKAGAYRYAQSEDFEILLLAYAVDDNPVIVVDLTNDSGQDRLLYRHFLALLDNPQYQLWAHNAAFEWYCLSRWLNRNPFSWADRWKCTMINALYLAYPPSLGELGKALALPEDKQKDKVGKQLINYFCKPCKATKVNGGRRRNYPHHDPEKWKLFIEYNRQDVESERAIEELLSVFPVPDSIWAEWHSDIRMNAYGTRVDKAMMDGALIIDKAAADALMTESRKLTGLENPKSVQQLSGWIAEQTGERPETLRKEAVEAMVEDQNLPLKVRRVLELRLMMSQTSSKKYDAMERAIGEGDRVRGMLQFYGASRTGRWAGRIVQLQNLKRTHLESLDEARQVCRDGDYDLMQLLWGDVPDALGQLVRTALIPSEGCVFVDADFSAIEARVVAWLAGEEWVLDVFRTTGKIYEATAASMFGVPMETIAKGKPNYELRQRGKVATLALGYQGGSAALKAMGALKMGIPEDDLPDIKRRWRQTNRCIVRLWDLCNRAALTVIKTGRAIKVRELLIFRLEEGNGLKFMTIQLPSGRKLFYPKPGVGTNRFGEESVTFWGISSRNNSSKKWQQLETYGGSIVENCVQAIARDCLAVNLKRLEAAGHRVVFHVHDEVIIDSPNDCLPDIIEIMSQPIEWAPGLPLNADGWVGEYFTKD
ncbi:MAG: DNA polymerase [Eubacteriales bacterium]|nr:DNA polymerase [Eubacteriales bacterium]